MRRQVSDLFQRRLPDQLQVGQMLQGPELGIANSSCKAELKTKLAATLRNVALPNTRKLPIELKKAWDKLKASGPGKLKNTAANLKWIWPLFSTKSAPAPQGRPCTAPPPVFSLSYCRLYCPPQPFALNAIPVEYSYGNRSLLLSRRSLKDYFFFLISRWITMYEVILNFCKKNMGLRKRGRLPK